MCGPQSELLLFSCKSCQTLLQSYGLQPAMLPCPWIPQEIILEWVAISFSRDLPHLGIEPISPALAGRFFTTEPWGSKPLKHMVCYGLPWWPSRRDSACNSGDVRDTGSILGLVRSPGGGHGNLLQYACLKNPHGQRSLAGYSP